MGKVSKSDTLDYEQEQTDRAVLARILSTPIKHWAIGSPVLIEGRRYTLTGIEYEANCIYLEDENGRHKFCFDPYFIQWETK